MQTHTKKSRERLALWCFDWDALGCRNIAKRNRNGAKKGSVFAPVELTPVPFWRPTTTLQTRVWVFVSLTLGQQQVLTLSRPVCSLHATQTIIYPAATYATGALLAHWISGRSSFAPKSSASEWPATQMIACDLYLGLLRAPQHNNITISTAWCNSCMSRANTYVPFCMQIAQICDTCRSFLMHDTKCCYYQCMCFYSLRVKKCVAQRLFFSLKLKYLNIVAWEIKKRAK
jgi:hypothetical protein